MNPDGCCLNAEGRVWSAEPFHRRVRLIGEGGTVVDEIAMPGTATAIACMLGGEDGRTLLIACLPELALQGRESKTDAFLLTTRVDVPHAGYP
ncbi:MAG: SMP-30/gluconolactonase/LRE family protein [Alphaproteobacteria bacterium]